MGGRAKGLAFETSTVYTQYMNMHSGFLISQTDGRPIYRQIMEQIQQRVAVGDWPPGQKLPSIRELAIAVQVSVITIKRAYLELEREGIIVTQHGKGSYVAPDPELGSQLHQRELDEHLAQAAHLGTVLGLDPEDLLNRLRQALERRAKDSG